LEWPGAALCDGLHPRKLHNLQKRTLQPFRQRLNRAGPLLKKPYPIPARRSIDPLKIKLGERLFGDPRLSHDNSGEVDWGSERVGSDRGQFCIWRFYIWRL